MSDESKNEATETKKPAKRRTVLMLPDQLVQRARHHAVNEHTALSRIVADALREYLASR